MMRGKLLLSGKLKKYHLFTYSKQVIPCMNDDAKKVLVARILRDTQVVSG